MRKIIPLFVSAILIVTLLGAAFFLLSRNHSESLLDEVASNDTTISTPVTIPAGASSTRVAALLREKGLIVDEAAFVSYLQAQGWDAKVQAGDYVLKPSTTIPDIAKRVTGQITDDVRITIPEGFTVRQIAQLLKKNGLVESDTFLACARECRFDFPFLPAAHRGDLEGFLFPETYTIDPATFSAASFLQEMLAETADVLSSLNADGRKGKRSLHDVMVMASMIEKETITDEERPIVAGILWKRLDAGWFLGVDATTRYFLNDWRNALTANDLDAENAYNTRKVKGPPPTPICNPGSKSIEAALTPVDSPYWYYLHDKNGIVRYGKTQEEHGANKAKYLR